jgi:hypothetical protein
MQGQQQQPEQEQLLEQPQHGQEQQQHQEQPVQASEGLCEFPCAGAVAQHVFATSSEKEDA